MVRYFAYGSNMAEDVMSSRCPQHRFVGIAALPDHRLAFSRRSVRTGTGVADIEPAAGETVWGALYELEDDSFAVLDRKEGRGWAYDRVTVDVLPGGDPPAEPAVTYKVVRPEPSEVQPGAEYLARVLAAARARGLPAAYIEALDSR